MHTCIFFFCMCTQTFFLEERKAENKDQDAKCTKITQALAHCVTVIYLLNCYITVLQSSGVGFSNVLAAWYLH